MSKKNLRRDKGKVKGKYIKDKAIVEFILQHSEKERIDFSKIKIPSFLDIIADEEKPTILVQCDSNKNDELTVQKCKKMPIFGFSLLNELSSDENLKGATNFKSSLF